MSFNSELYPISIDDIEKKILRKNLKKRRFPHSQNTNQLSLFDNKIQNIKTIVNEFGEKIVRVDGEIPVDLPVKNKDRFLFISYDQSRYTHGLHKYPAKFFPELPRWIIKRYSKEFDVILDPFTGSGTTNLEALLNKRHSVGIDVDPFSRYLAKVKVTPLDAQELTLAKEELLKQITDFNPLNVSKEDIPDFPYRDNWFNKEIVLELAYIKKLINELNYSNDIQDFFRICFSSIIRAVSNADDNCTRTVIRKKLNKKVFPADALTKFVECVLINVPKMIEFSKVCPQNIFVEIPEEGDARDIKYPDAYFDLAVTSPPYANAVDYPRTHQLEIYWLEIEKGSLTPLKKQHVGTESVTADDYKELHLIGIKEADLKIKKIYEKDKRRAFIAFKYLKDMEKNLKEVFRVLKVNGRYVVVVGNNKIRGELFENWKYLMSLAKNIGFEIESYFASEIIRHFIKVPREERINTDWIIVLRKP